MSESMDDLLNTQNLSSTRTKPHNLKLPVHFFCSYFASRHKELQPFWNLTLILAQPTSQQEVTAPCLSGLWKNNDQTVCQMQLSFTLCQAPKWRQRGLTGRRFCTCTKGVGGGFCLDPKDRGIASRNGILPRPLLLGNRGQLFLTYSFFISQPILKDNACLHISHFQFTSKSDTPPNWGTQFRETVLIQL